VPEPVLERAGEVLAELETHQLRAREKPLIPNRKRRKERAAGPSLFDPIPATEAKGTIETAEKKPGP
jgi:hypothetical protein